MTDQQEFMLIGRLHAKWGYNQQALEFFRLAQEILDYGLSLPLISSYAPYDQVKKRIESLERAIKEDEEDESTDDKRDSDVDSGDGAAREDSGIETKRLRMEDSNSSQQTIEDFKLDGDKVKPYLPDWGNGLPHLVIEKIAKFEF